MRSIRYLTLAVALLAGAAATQEPTLSVQERARLRFQTLHESMQRLQVALSETSPDESRALRVGNKFVQEARIHDRMREVRTLLEESRWDEALEEMGDIREKLHSLMNLLLDRDLDLQKLLEEIEQLEAFKERVDDLIDEQRAEKDAAARSEALAQHLQQLERASEELEQLAADQRALKGRANEAGMSAAAAEAQEMAEQEAELEEKAKELAERAAELEQENDELTQPEGEPGDGDGAESPPQDGACAGACKGASGAMGEAQRKLGQNRPESSLEDMDKALKKLDEAKKALEQLSEKARRELLSLPFDEQAKAQEITRIATDKLAEDMEQAGQGEEDAAEKETPGTQNVQQAVPKQRAAAGQLKEHKPKEAKQEQQDAVEELEDAQQALEDALAQLRQQLQDEVLRALEERFGAMLAKQKELTARTLVTDRLRGESLTASGGLPASLVQRCGELSEGELGLASEAGDALKLLQEEGTTAVFPEIVEELRDDLDRVGARLAEQHTGSATQGMQREIEDTLSLLIDALRKSIEDSEGQAGQCDGQPPLVPMSAELKLILALQKRVHARTVDYDGTTAAADRAKEEARAEAGEIARKQGRVKQLTRKLATALNKEADASDQ